MKTFVYEHARSLGCLLARSTRTRWPLHRAAILGAACACVCFSLACGGAPQGKAVRETLETMSDAQRESTFEATAQALDDRPDYVDQFYDVARQHPKMFHRFLANASRDLDEPELARATAQLIASHPEALRQVLLATLQAAEPDPPARAVIAQAIEERHVLVSSILTDRPSAVVATMNATLQQAQRKPEAQAALLRAMRESSSRVAAVLAADPKTLSVLAGAMVEQGVEASGLKRSIEQVFHSE